MDFLNVLVCSLMCYFIEFHTPPVEDLPYSIRQRECDFQMDWHDKQLYLKVSPPLYNILVQSTTEGVDIHEEESVLLIHLQLLLFLVENLP